MAVDPAVEQTGSEANQGPPAGTDAVTGSAGGVDVGAQAAADRNPADEHMARGLRATNSPDLIQLLSPEGVFTPHPDFPLEVTADLLKGLYRDMVLVRRFDREGNSLQRQGQLSIWVPLLGQEAAQIGSGRALRPQDFAFPSYREHGVAWCRGVDPTELLGIFRGTDHSGWDPVATRFHDYTIVIGNQALNGAGYAMGQAFDGKVGSGDLETDEATIVYFGDGGTAQGDIHEGMVFAAAFDAPVVFYCQNNQWAISEPIEKMARVPLYKRAAGYGMPGFRVDGNDVLACLAVSRWALDECRSGNGPVMIEAFTYRMDAHTTSDDPTRYRLADETEHWKLLDPIERVRAHLAREGLADKDFFDAVQAESDELADRFRSFAVAMQVPSHDRIFSNVYTDPNPQVQRQQQQFDEYLAGFDSEGGQ